MQRTRKALIVGALAAVPFLAGGFMVQSRQSRDGAKLFDEVLSLVSDRFVDTLDNGALYEKAARGLVHELNDPYSELLSPKELQSFTTRTGGRYGGIGMQIEDQKGNITVSHVFPHTPAEEAGVQEGDRIISVDTALTHGWKIGQVSDALIGTPGTKVSVRFERPGVSQPIIVRFTRAVIHIPAVPYAIMLDGNVGYVPLQQFNETAAEEISDAVQHLMKEGARGVVIDLRGNPGGILDQALASSNLFLKQGQEIASVRGRQGPPQVYTADQKPLTNTLPLVLLTDGYSASASEILAGALQDHDRALIVGETSFGKGLVQTLFPIDGGWALKITTAKWYTPSGRSIQKPRTLLPNGDLVEDDSLHPDSVKKNKPAYRSDAGRIVYGGGAITPDVVVPGDTLSAAEQALAKALAPKVQETYVVLYQFSLDLKNKVQPTFTTQPSWRDDFYNRLQAAGVNIDRKVYDAAPKYVDRLIANRLARLAFGDSTAKRRELNDDAQLRTAVDLLKKGGSQKDLFVIAEHVRKSDSSNP